MTVTIGRRELLAALGGAAIAWPLAARAQQAAMPVIGYLSLAGNPNLSSFPAVRAFLEGLAQAGYVPGRNLTIEFRLANFRGSILPQLAADLVAHKVAVIITSGSPYAAVAAKDLDDANRLHDFRGSNGVRPSGQLLVRGPGDE